jgi:hypothetical protein
MAQALEQQLAQSGISAVSFEERLALLVDREVHGRQDRHCALYLRLPRLGEELRIRHANFNCQSHARVK